MARLLGIAAWAGAAAAMPPCASQAADKPAVAPEAAVARLLELGDRYSPDAVTKVRAYYRGLGSKSADDGRVQYALTLVLIVQHSHTEAVELLDKIVAREPDALHLRRTGIWAKMAAHQEREALADIRSLADVLARQSPATLPTDEADAWRTTASFLGRVFGFLEVPRTGAPPADELRAARQYVLARLGNEQAEFNQNQEAVAEKFSKARAASEDLRAKRVSERMTKKAEYEKQKKAVDEAETNVDADTEKVKANTQTEIVRIDHSAETLQKSIAARQSQLNDVQLAIQAIQIRLLRLSGQLPSGVASGTPGSAPVNGRMMTSAQLNNQLQQLSAQQIMLSQQIMELNRQMQATLAQRDFSLGKGEQTAEELKTHAAALKREEKRLERAEQTEAKKIAAERQKPLTKQTSFASFEPFPLDIEKQRVLGTASP